MGTLKGVPIPIKRGEQSIGVKKDKDNKTVLTKLNEQILIDIAIAGNGTYARAKGMNIGIDKIIDRINKIDKSTLDIDRYTSYDDQFQPYLLAGIILLLLDFLIENKRGRFAQNFQLFRS